MKKLLLAALPFMLLGSLSAETAVWNKENNFDGWKVAYNTLTKIEEGVFKLYNIKFDPYICNLKADIDPEKYDTLVYTYRTTGKKRGGQFYFNHAGEKFSDRRAWRLPEMIGDGQWHTFKVKPDNLESWKKGGRIIELRLDPTDSAGGTVEIKEIRLEKSAEVPAPAVYKFDASNNFGPQVLFARCSGKIANGVIKLDELKVDNSIYFRKLNIDTSKYDKLVITYRANGMGSKNGQFYFTAGSKPFNGANCWVIPPLKSDNQWNTVTIIPRNIANWNAMKKVDQIRIDPSDSAGGTIEIKEIRLENSGNAGRTVWNSINNFGGWKAFHNCKGKVENGILKITNIRRDPGFSIQNLKIDPKKFNSILVTYRATGTGSAPGQLYFIPPKGQFNAKQFWKTNPLVSDGAWHTMVLSSHDLSKWLDCEVIGGLRYDPTDSAGGTIEIKEISLENLTAEDIKKKSSVKIEGKYDAPVWPTVKSEIWPSKRAAVTAPEHYFKGFIVRAVDDVLQGRQHEEFYLRKTFTLKDKPVHGYLQYTADDCAEAFVNEKAAGYSSTWKTGICVDVTKSLKAGKNILAFHYLNPETYGGVLCELYVQYADGSCERINSDKTFKCSSKLENNWASLTYNDSNWANAVEQPAPPAAPWKVVIPYKYFQNMQKVISAEMSPKVVAAGTTPTLKILFEGYMPAESLEADIVLKNQQTLLWRETVTLDKKYFKKISDGKWLLEYPWKAPYYLVSNDMDISIETKSFTVQSASIPSLKFRFEQLEKDPTVPAKINMQVARNGKQTYFELNGKPFFPMWITAALNVDDPNTVNLVTVGPPREFQVRVGELNFAELDIAAEKQFRRHPNAYFMWNIKLYVSRDFANRYPQDMCTDESGKINKVGWDNHSHASERAYKELEDVMVRTIEYLEKSPYANRIVGYRVTGGYTTEWLGWESRSNKALDFSPPSKKAYAEFARQKYPTLEDLSVPTQKERLARDGQSLLWDQKKNLRLIAYNDFTSNTTLDFMLRLSKKAQEMVGDTKVIGSYYGYVSTLHYTGRSQVRAHYALKKLLDAKVLDFIMSPQSYPLRGLGDTCGEMKPTASMKNHNMVTALENDTRTHYAQAAQGGGSELQTVTEKQTMAQFLRNFAQDICRSQPAFYITMNHGNEINYPKMHNMLKLVRTLGQKVLENKAQRHAEVALVVSEEAIKSMPIINEIADSGVIKQSYNTDGSVKRIPKRRPVLNYETFVGNQGRFNRSGALVDQVLAEDLADNPGDYKLYVFLNCYKYDEKFLQAIKKLQQKDCVLLWLYAPGYIKGLESSIANMKELTGIDFELMPYPMSSAATFADKRVMGTPYAEVTPLFAAKNSGVEVLARYKNGKPAVVAKKTGKALSVFSGAWQLDMEFIAEMLKRANVYRYITTPDAFDACTDLAVLHARYPGKKVIKLPKKATVIDVENKVLVGKNIDRIESSFDLHQTKCYYFGKDAEKLLEELKQIK